MSAIGRYASAEERLLPSIQSGDVDDLASMVSNLRLTLPDERDKEVDAIINLLAKDKGLKKKEKSQLAQKTVQFMSDQKIEPKLRLIALMGYLRKKEVKELCQKISDTYYSKIGEALKVNNKEPQYVIWYTILSKGPTSFSEDKRREIQVQVDAERCQDQQDYVTSSGF